MKRHAGRGSEAAKTRTRKNTSPRKRRKAAKPAPIRETLAAAYDDIAKAGRLEQSLRTSEERYALVIEALAEGLYDWNIETNALYVSPRLIEIFNFAEARLTAEAWSSHVHPDDMEGYRTALRDCFRQRSPKLECQYRIRAAAGSYRWVEDHGLPIRNKAGRAIRLVGAVSDITRRHEAEQALRARDQELDAVLDTIDYAVLFMGPDLRAKIINRAFRQMWGISDEFIRTTRPTMSDLINYNRHKSIYDVPEAEFDAYVSRRVEAVARGSAFIGEMRLLDGRIIQHRVMVLPDGGRMLTYFDITVLRRRAEQLESKTLEIAKLNAQLEQRVSDQVAEIERMGRLRRFLPPQVADLIVASGTEKQLESHRREITALFCDLRGFTGFSESSDPEDVMALLRQYHEAIGQIIIKYSGTLERYAGDGVMVVFNDPVPVENPALQAVLMALDMRTAIGELIDKWQQLGHDLGFGIGIAHGFATLGTIGFEGRRDYAAIGTVSNVASRLCDEAKPGQILISPRVLLAVDKAVTVEPAGEFALKGIRRPMMAYNVLDASPSKPS
jgi:PAS domain S-box-containing protein